MKSIRTDPSNHAAEGDERIRTAVPDGTNDPAYDRVADLLNSEWFAPRSRTDRRWRVTGANRGLLRLSPQLGSFSDPSSYMGGGGVKAIHRTYGELLQWTPANDAARRVARGVSS